MLIQLHALTIFLSLFFITSAVPVSSIQQKSSTIAWVDSNLAKKIDFIAEWCSCAKDIKQGESAAIQAFIEVYKHLNPAPFTKEAIQQAFRAEINAFQNNRTVKHILKVTCNEEIIAGIFFDMLPSNEVYIERLFVRPDFQRNGLATKLIYSIYEKNPATKKIFLMVRRSNDNAIAFYKKLGFVECDYTHEGFEPKDFVGYVLECVVPNFKSLNVLPPQ